MTQNTPNCIHYRYS